MPRQAVKERLPSPSRGGPGPEVESGLAQMKPGEFRTGFVGTPPSRVPDPEPEVLTPEEGVERQVLINLLLKWLTPNNLNPSRPNPAADKKSLASKLNRSELKTLRQFFDIDIPEAVKAALQRQYLDISP